ncbi:MAG: hypothetical protein LUD00_04440 [Prevotellaceae bacterium]|nr:hypothetical protein [Prevotellaceae bacterium]
MSSSVFAVEPDNRPLLFDLTVDDSFCPEDRGKEIGVFNNEVACYRFLQTENGDYQIIIADADHRPCGLMQTNSTFSHSRISLSGPTELRRFGLNNALMMMYAFASSDKGTLLMHSSVVCNSGKGFLFLGKSGTGKSTHSQLWMKHVQGTELLNDDNPVVRVMGKEIRVYGSPWSGKTDCYRNEHAIVGAFLQLQQAPYNHIRRQTTIETFASLLSSSSVMKWDKRVYGGVCDSIKLIMERVQGFMLQCRPDKEAALLSHKTIAG